MCTNRILGLCLMATGTFLLWQAGKLPSPSLNSLVGPAFFPLVWGSLLLLFGCLLLLKTCIPYFKRMKNATGGPSTGWRNYAKVIEMFVATLAYFALMQLIGFVASSILYIVYCVTSIGIRSARALAAATLVAVPMVFGLYAFFYYGMGTFLPAPVWS